MIRLFFLFSVILLSAFLKTAHSANIQVLPYGETQLSSKMAFLGAGSKKDNSSSIYSVVQLSEQEQKEYRVEGTSENRINYNIIMPSAITESKSTVYYNTSVKSKGAVSRFFVGDHVSARMQTFHNSAIPFLAKGDGISTEVSTQSTNVTATYFKVMPQMNEQNIGDMYQRKMQPLSSDTKLGMSVPFLPQLKFFGGYSYNRSMEARLIKGPSFGFQADLFKYANINTTIVKPGEGKTAAKVLFSLNIPFDRIAF